MRATTSGSAGKLLAFLFASFDGRVSRGMFWWAGSVLFAGQMALTVIMARATGLGLRDFLHGDRRALWVNLVVVAFFFWPSLALAVKRLHDRDLPGWWAGLLHALLFIFYIDQAATRAILRDKSAILLSLVPVAMLFLVGAWLIVELAFLAGTRGPNSYGPPPSEPVPGQNLPDRATVPLSEASAASRAGE